MDYEKGRSDRSPFVEKINQKFLLNYLQSDIKNNANIVRNLAARWRTASVLNVNCTGPAYPQQECIEEGIYRARKISFQLFLTNLWTVSLLKVQT